MSEPTRQFQQTPAASLLRSYLAERDVKCASCGYNLRGSDGVLCPECGTVIPSPPAEFLERKRIETAALKLCCQTCGYVVTGVDAPKCPECGAVELRRFEGDEPSRVRLKRRPLLRLLFVGLGMFFTVACGLAMLKRGITGFNNGLVDPGLGLMLSLGAAGIGVAWILFQPRIDRLEPGERKAVGLGIGLVMAGMLVAGSLGVR